MVVKIWNKKNEVSYWFLSDKWNIEMLRKCSDIKYFEIIATDNNKVK